MPLNSDAEECVSRETLQMVIIHFIKHLSVRLSSFLLSLSPVFIYFSSSLLSLSPLLYLFMFTFHAPQANGRSVPACSCA